MQTLRTFDDERKRSDIIELTKSEVLKAVAYALLRRAYGVYEPQKPNVKQRINFFDEVRRFEISLIMQALLYSNGSKAGAGRLLNLNATTLHSKIKLYSIEIPVATNGSENPRDSLVYRSRRARGITRSADPGSMNQLRGDESVGNDADSLVNVETFSSDIETIKTEVIRSIARVLEFNATNYLSVFDFDGKRGVNFYDEVMKFEIELLTQALAQVNGNQRAAARLLSMKTTTLNSKVKLYRLNVDFIAA